MTSEEVRKMINDWGDKNGLESPFPSPHYCDHETFANLAATICNNARQRELENNDVLMIYPFWGDNGGLMFKGIEFILGVME